MDEEPAQLVLPAASAYLSAKEWAKLAVPFLLKLGARDNGKPLTVSGIPEE